MLSEVYDFLVSNYLFFWLIVSIFFLLLEMGSPGLFFFLSFFFGALMAAGSTFFVDSTVWQSVVFLIGSALSFLVLHFWVKKRFSKEKHHEHTNVSALKGKRATVLKTIQAHGVGSVKVGGEIWSAKSLDHQEIAVGVLVEVIDIKGVHLIVKGL